MRITVLTGGIRKLTEACMDKTAALASGILQGIGGEKIFSVSKTA
jgi:hypothetical protein